MSEAETLKVTPIESKQPQAQCRFTINAVLRGFPITVEGEGRAGDLKFIVERLLDAGAEPPKTSNATLPVSETKAAGAPLCPTHNTPMKASQKPGTFFCPKKNEDGSYCRHKA